MNGKVETGSPGTRPPCRVLIVDDALAIRNYLRFAIEELPGARVVGEARTVLEARQLLEKHKPNVVTLDIHLPDGSGIDVLKLIHEAAWPCTTIVLTNYPYEQYQKACRDAGAAHFLDKSREFDKVAEILQQLAEDSSQK